MSPLLRLSVSAPLLVASSRTHMALVAPFGQLIRIQPLKYRKHELFLIKPVALPIPVQLSRPARSSNIFYLESTGWLSSAICSKSQDQSLDAAPPTVSDTKEKFYQAFRRPLNPIYNTVVQELLVQQHIIRYNRKYHYDAVGARHLPCRTELQPFGDVPTP